MRLLPKPAPLSFAPSGVANLLLFLLFTVPFPFSVATQKCLAQNEIPSSSVNTLPNSEKSQNFDTLLKNFQSGQSPVLVPPISFVDVNSGRFGKLEIDLTDGQFLDAAVDQMHLTANNLDVKEGLLKSLEIDIKGGHLQDFIFDHLSINTQGDLKFNPGIFLNHNLLQFTEPATAIVTATISEKSLNSFLNSPVTLNRLSVKAGGKAAALASLIGVNPANLGLNISQAELEIKKGDAIFIDFQSSIGMGQIGLPINAQIQGKLGLNDGLLNVSDLHLLNSGQEISADLSNLLLKKIANVFQSAQNSADIRFRFTDLKVAPHKHIQLKGTAEINRLRFGHR